MVLEGFFMNNPLGLYAFLGLIPFIMLYLRRPKVVTKTIPSLMFLIRQQGSLNKYTLFRTFFTSVLFLIQLLLICALAYAAAAPYLIMKDTTASKTTYIIVDASASMQATQGSSTRFEKAIAIAEQELKGAISIIKAGNAIEIVLKDGSKAKAESILKSLKPDDAPTNLEAAMSRADTLLEGKKARIIVISDFMNAKSGQDDPLKARRILTSKGNEVIFKEVAGKGENLAFIDLAIDKEKTRVYVKNYGEKKEVTTKQYKDSLVVMEQKKTIDKNSVDFFEFPTQEGAARIVLDPKDGLLIDNTVFTSSPFNKKIKVVLLTNKKSPYLVSALTASKFVDFGEVKPPFTIEQIRQQKPDLIITNNLNKKELLPGDFDGIKSLVANGTSLVIIAQDDLKEIDFSDVLPVTLAEKGQSTKVNKNIVNQFTKDVDFSVYHTYFKGEAVNGSLVIASADDHSPLIVFQERNKGKIIYYGLFDEDSDFKTTPGYPIFWNELINFLVETENIADYNKKIDHVPQAKKVGIIKENGRDVAVNLLDEQESNIGFEDVAFKQDLKRFVVDDTNIERKIDIEKYLLYAVIALLFIELLYVKLRGDL